MAVDARRDQVERALSDTDGILRLAPAWVARDFLPPGRRLGLAEDAYELGDRGATCERWLASTTRGRQPDRTRRRGAELPRPRRSRSRSRSGRRSRATRPRSWARSTPPPTRVSGGSRRSSTTAPGCRSTCTSGRSTPPSSAAAPRTRRTTSRRASTWGRTRSRSSACIRSVAEAGNHALLLPFLEDWDSDLILQHSVGLRAGRRSGLPHPVRRPARAGERADDRAAGGLGRLRDAAGAQRRPDHLEGAAVEGRAARGP